MVSFSATILLSAFLVLSSSAHAAENDVRKLSRDIIAGYEPFTQVTDHNAIDKDQEAMEKLLSVANEEAYIKAFRIYTEGAHSVSYANVVLTSAVTQPFEKGTDVAGRSENGNQINGWLFADVSVGATNMLVQYQTGDSQNTYVDCQVGASETPNTRGCFAASGAFSIKGLDVQYTYDPMTDNDADRTIQSMSLNAKKEMWQCKNCPYELYQAFVEYYGFFDYGNQIVEAAFEGRATDFLNFNSDFALYGFTGREQIIKKGTAFVIIWMYVIRELEDALDDCRSKCSKEDCNDDLYISDSWDKAVAYYTGTLEGDNGAGSGKLPYALADKRCGNFKTCGESGDQLTGTSKVNIEIFRNFEIGKGFLKNGKCEEAQPHKDNIQRLMMIPLIQGTLRYGWKTDNEAYSEKAEAEGAIFALAITPVINKCDPKSAEIIAKNMKVGQTGSADFNDLKKAFESTYDCLGITGFDVGGLFDAASMSYFDGAEPLDFVPGAAASKKDSDAASSLGFGVTLGTMLVASVTTLLI